VLSFLFNKLCIFYIIISLNDKESRREISSNWEKCHGQMTKRIIPNQKSARVIEFILRNQILVPLWWFKLQLVPLNSKNDNFKKHRRLLFIWVVYHTKRPHPPNLWVNQIQNYALNFSDTPSHKVDANSKWITVNKEISHKAAKYQHPSLIN
jgi:hypothetical protein